MDITAEQELDFRKSTRCSACNKTSDQIMKKCATTATPQVNIRAKLA